MGGRGVWEITLTDQEPNDAARRHEELAERALAEQARLRAGHGRRARAIDRRARLSVALVWVVGGGLIVVPPVVAAFVAYPAPVAQVVLGAFGACVGCAIWAGIKRAAAVGVKWVRGGGV